VIRSRRWSEYEQYGGQPAAQGPRRSSPHAYLPVVLAGRSYPEQVGIQTLVFRPYPAAALAHPITQPFNLPLSPLEAAGAAAAVVLAAAFLAPRARGEAPARVTGAPLTSWAGSLRPSQVVARAVAFGLLVLAVVAGRAGPGRELDNLAPALVVGAGWPLLVLASIVVGPVWRWTDPWDSAARVLPQGHPGEEGGHVWTAALVAVGLTWYLSAYTAPLDPRSVGALVAVYTLFTLAGCLAFGRVRWLSTSEPLGITLSWMARLPRRRLVDWDPPRGAEPLLGAIAGGVLFGAVRRSELWGDLNTAEHGDLIAALGHVGFCVAAAGLITVMAVSGETTAARAAAARAAVPAVAGIVLAVAVDRNRLFTSVQLLPELLGDPFGRGWDPFGRADASLYAAPLRVEGLLWAQLGLLAAGHAVGALVAARRVERGARIPVALGLGVLVAASAVAITSH
jgi:hypothetical protein